MNGLKHRIYYHCLMILVFTFWSHGVCNWETNPVRLQPLTDLSCHIHFRFRLQLMHAPNTLQALLFVMVAERPFTPQAYAHSLREAGRYHEIETAQVLVHAVSHQWNVSPHSRAEQVGARPSCRSAYPSSRGLVPTQGTSCRGSRRVVPSLPRR